MRFRFLKGLAIASAASLICVNAYAAWTKSFVIDWYEPAMYFGGEDILGPGTDCPKGTNPEIDWVQVLIKAGYTPEEAKWLRNPENPSRSPVHGQNQMAFRGRNRENVYIYPETYPDPGLIEVSGEISEGFDLDGNAKTGHRSPTGEKGIDNNFYRALGCTKSYRGPTRLFSNALGANDTMRNGGWTVVVVVHGEGKDPMNDANVQVGIYMSGDKLVKDGNSEIARDYTFRIKPSKLEAIFKASTRNGVIATQSPTPEVWIHDAGGTRDLQLLQAQLKLQMKPDGTLEGLLGGYRPWQPIYKALVNARGPVVEILGWIEIPAIYYALKRNADYSPKGANGEKTHISYAMRLHAIPAYVATPDSTALATSVESYSANAKFDPPPRPAFGAIDGMVPDPRVPFGKSLEKYPVPKLER